MEDMSYQNGTFSFDFSNYELGIQTPDAGSKMCANSAKGQHIHLIANTQPYAAYYTSAFQHDLPNGEHYLLAFLSRSYHESIKNGQAYIAKQVNIQDKTLQEASDISEPMLFYSRPKGTYVGAEQTDKVMLDFFLLNAELGDSYKVKAVINDEEHILDGWQPYFIEGLPMGENMITLTLIDAEGNKVDTPLNPVTRKFTLKAAPAEAAPCAKHKGQRRCAPLALSIATKKVEPPTGKLYLQLQLERCSSKISPYLDTPKVSCFGFYFVTFR